jgi:zinc transport system substrate-binding protein
MTVMNSPRRLIRTASAATALGIGALALTGCGGPTDSARDGGGKVNVIASFYPLQYLAEQIGGSHVSVQTLTKPGTEPHDLELSPQQTGQLSDAGLIVYLRGLQPAVDEAIDQSGAKHVADAASFTTLEKHGDDVHGERGRAARTHAGAGEGSASADPHIWLDPVRYAQAASGVGKELAKADPAHKAYYAKHTAGLVRRVHALDADFHKGLRTKKKVTFVTTHSAFGYLAERYGLHEEGVSGIDPESEPSAQRMKQLHKVATADDIHTVFFEDNASNKTAKTLADDMGLKTGVLSPLESVKHPASEDYFTVMHHNLRALQDALDAR